MAWGRPNRTSKARGHQRKVRALKEQRAVRLSSLMRARRNGGKRGK